MDFSPRVVFISLKTGGVRGGGEPAATKVGLNFLSVMLMYS